MAAEISLHEAAAVDLSSNAVMRKVQSEHPTINAANTRKAANPVSLEQKKTSNKSSPKKPEPTPNQPTRGEQVQSIS